MERRAAILALALVALLALAVPSAPAPGPTYVQEVVSGTWTVEGSPYILVGNATVPEGLTLSIAPGVEVRANRGVHLGVFGTLEVAGTPDARVRFTANGTGAPGFWKGIVASGIAQVSVAHAVVEFADVALSLTGVAATIEGASLSQSMTGLAVFGGTATVAQGVLSHNVENGILARDTALTVRGALFNGNRAGLTLAATQALLENATFLGPTLADASVDLTSYLRLRASALAGEVKIVDAASRVDLEGLLAVSVTDAFGVPLAGASVLVEDNPNGTASILARTDREGRVRLVVTERTILKVGEVDFNPFTITASVGEAQAGVIIAVRGAADVTIAVPVDGTPPMPVAAPLVAAVEDEPVVLDASASEDNDPSLLETGTFRWSFPEVGVERFGVTATITFSTPGLYQGILTATDRAGNRGVLAFAVRVRDVTRPQIVELLGPERGAVGEFLTFQASATDNDPGFATGASFAWRFTLGDDHVDAFGPRVQIALDRPGTWRVDLVVTDPDGNAAVEGRSLVIAGPPPPPSPLPWIGGGAALLAAALGLASERGKLGLLTLLLPLYSRLKDDEVLDQFTRGQIYGYIRVHPGDTYTDIKRNLELNNGTLTYHLNVLEKEGLIRARTRGSRKMFYPVDVRPAEDGGGLHELQQRLIRVLGEAPGADVGDLAGVLGVSRQLALYHLRLLSQQGLVRLERKGLKLRGFAVERQA